MKDIEYRRVVLLEEWAKLLGDIFDNASEAIEAGDTAMLLQVQDQIRTYIKRSPSKCAYLDEIAQDLARDLYDAVAEKKIDAIAEHNRRLTAAIAMVERATDENRDARDAIAIEELREKLGGVTHLVDSVSGDMSSDAAKELLAEIEALRDRIG